MTNINIQNASNVFVEGSRTHRNCKAVYCITTGEMYASVLDAAEANGVSQCAMSWNVCGKSKTCNGKRFCLVSEMTEHLNEIVENSRVRTQKVSAYDEIVERRKAVREAEERVAERKARCEELRNALEAEMALFADAEQELNELREELK